MMMNCSCEECTEACSSLRKSGDIIHSSINEKYCNDTTLPSQFGNFFFNSFNVMIYLIMYMLLFWFKVTDLLLRLATYLHNAERSVKVATGIFFIIIMSAIFIDTQIQKTRVMETLQKHEDDCVLNYETSKNNYLNKEHDLIDQAKEIQQPDLTPTEETSTITRIFTLLVTDEKNKEIYKTVQRVNLPAESTSNPIAIILTEPSLS